MLKIWYPLHIEIFTIDTNVLSLMRKYLSERERARVCLCACTHMRMRSEREKERGRGRMGGGGGEGVREIER
jgi:hypothetical protein